MVNKVFVYVMYLIFGDLLSILNWFFWFEWCFDIFDSSECWCICKIFYIWV